MTASQFLLKQHRELREMFDALRTHGEQSQSLVFQLADMLEGHIVVEQELLYPRLDRRAQQQAHERHAAVRFCMKRLVQTPPSDSSFSAKLQTLGELVELHMRDEETHLFPLAERALGAQSAELGRHMAELFEHGAEGTHRHGQTCPPPNSSRQSGPPSGQSS